MDDPLIPPPIPRLPRLEVLLPCGIGLAFVADKRAVGDPRVSVTALAGPDALQREGAVGEIAGMVGLHGFLFPFAASIIRFSAARFPT